MKMPIIRFGIAVFLAVALSGCFGGGGPATPKHLSAGAGQNQSGMEYYQTGCYHRALEHFFRAHEFHAASGQVDGIAVSLNNIGTAYRGLADYESAAAFFTEAAQLFAQAQNPAGERQALVNLAAVRVSQDDPARAAAILDRAANITVSNETGPFVPLINSRAVVAIKQGQLEKARELVDSALALLAPESDPLAGSVYFTCGTLLSQEGDYGQAADYFEKALIEDRKSGFYKGMADDLSALARAREAQGDAQLATEAWKSAVQIYALLEMKPQTTQTMDNLEKSAAQANMDLAVTRLFVERWMEGKGYTRPCR